MASVRETILSLVLAGYLEASVKKPSFVSVCVDWFLSHFQVGQISLAISLQGSQCILSSFWFPPPVPLHICTQCTHESCIVLFPQQSRRCRSQSQPNDTSKKACFPDLRKKKDDEHFALPPSSCLEHGCETRKYSSHLVTTRTKVIKVMSWGW